MAGVVTTALTAFAATSAPAGDDQSPWLWALAVVSVGVLVAALIVLVRDHELPPQRGMIWAIIIFLLPLFGPAAYLGWEVMKRRQLRRDRESDG